MNIIKTVFHSINSELVLNLHGIGTLINKIKTNLESMEDDTVDLSSSKKLGSTKWVYLGLKCNHWIKELHAWACIDSLV